MKIQAILSVLVVILLSACGEVTEEITIKNDSSGSYEVSSDMIPMMRQMMYGIAKMSVEEGEEVDSLELVERAEKLVWKDFPDEVDSTLSIDSELPPEVKDDPKAMALLEQTTMYMRGGKKKGYMKTGVKFNFNNDQEFKDFMELMEENSSKDKKANMLGQPEIEMKITPKLFVRTSKAENVSEDDATPQLASLLADMQMITIINFDRKIKNVELVHYDIIEQSAKSIKLKYNLVEAMEDGTKSEIRIDLK